MKKIALLTAGLVFVWQTVACAWGSQDPATGSGYKTASVQITTSPCTVWGFAGLSKTAAVPSFLCNGTATDSSTVGYQLIPLINATDEDTLNYVFPYGIKFPRGCYLNVSPTTGSTVNAAGTVFYTTP